MSRVPPLVKLRLIFSNVALFAAIQWINAEGYQKTRDEILAVIFDIYGPLLSYTLKAPQ